MHFGSRNIRSAGRSSGSVEVTLPVELAILEGISCRFDLRDGLTPEIVLQPDLQALMPVFEHLWGLLGIGLETAGDIGDFFEGDYSFALFRTAKLGRLAPLAYADALMLRRHMETAAELPPPALDAFARLIESMAGTAGQRLGLAPDLAALYGNYAAYLTSGEAIGARDAYARSAALQLFSPRRDGLCRSAPLAADLWRRAQNELARAFDQFMSWNSDPETFTNEREQWYRARHFEARQGATT